MLNQGLDPALLASAIPSAGSWIIHVRCHLAGLDFTNCLARFSRMDLVNIVKLHVAERGMQVSKPAGPTGDDSPPRSIPIHYGEKS